MKQITKEQMIAWIGSDNETFDYVLDILHQVVNGTWSVESLRSDISSSDVKPVEEYEVYVPSSNKVLVKPAAIWSQLNDTFVDENIMHIDAYVSEDENEEGRVIAKIDITTGKVCYLDERARTDSMADELIADNVREILEGLEEDLKRTMDKMRGENF